MKRSDDISTASALKVLTGRMVARAIRFVTSTSTLSSEPADMANALKANHPAIIAMWHGQFLLVPAVSPKGIPVRTVVARHGDAEVLAEILRAFDMSLIRGAGAGNRKRDRGGVHLLRSAVTALGEGFMVPMTADVPPGPARRAGLGIVTLARLSGRPIVPFAIASSNYAAFNTWSRLTINLPFSRIGACLGAPINVPRDSSPEALEGYRREVEQALDKATRTAYRLAKAEALRATPPSARARMGGDAKPGPDVRLQLYRAATQMLRPVAPFILQRREMKGKEDPKRRDERYGIASRPRPPGPVVWVHAASVGETNTILPLISGLAQVRPDISFLLTTGTVTSARLAADRLPSTVIHQYLPLDASAFMRRFLEHWRPGLAILTESEIWPNLVLETAGFGTPIALINGRLSKRSYRGWQKRRNSALSLFSRLDLVLAQNIRVADWFIDLGAPRVVMTGNLKIDAPPPPIAPEALAALRMATQGRTVFLAASTHDDEETQVALVHQRLRANLPSLLTVIAPRHPERGPALADAVANLGLKVRRRAAGELPDASTDVYLADTIGELGTLFALAPVCLMGGSLVPHGGQNPIEAIKHGCGVLTGPHTANFKDTYEALLSAKGARRVGSAAELQEAAREILQDREKLAQMQRKAETSVAEMTGALQRSLTALIPLLPSPTLEVERANDGTATSHEQPQESLETSLPAPTGGPQVNPGTQKSLELPAQSGLRHAGS